MANMFCLSNMAKYHRSACERVSDGFCYPADMHKSVFEPEVLVTSVVRLGLGAAGLSPR